MLAVTAGGLLALGLLALGLLPIAGCTQEERRTTARSAAQSAATLVTAAAGQAATSTTAAPGRAASGVKPNGRGGFDASAAQKAALNRAHYIRDHKHEIFRPYRPTTRPTSQPAAG